MNTTQRLPGETRISASAAATVLTEGGGHTEGAFQSVEPARMPAKVTLSLVIPCYNEEKTLETCVDKVLAIADDALDLELIIVDDCSKDRSLRLLRG